MKFLKNNFKVIVGFIIGVILASSIAVYAYSYFASDVKYTDTKTVEQALDELYANKKETSDMEKIINSNGKQTLDKYYKFINVNVLSESDELNTLTAYAFGNVTSTSSTVNITQDQTAKFVCSIRATNGNQTYCNVYVNGNLIVNHISQTPKSANWIGNMSVYDVELNNGDEVYITVNRK